MNPIFGKTSKNHRCQWFSCDGNGSLKKKKYYHCWRKKHCQRHMDPGFWVHNSNHPNSRSRRLLSQHYWHGLISLTSFLVFEYFYKTQEEVFLVFFVSPYISRNQKCYLPWGMIWVIDSIPWVRCASGNVFLLFSTFSQQQPDLFQRFLSGGVTCISSNFGHHYLH